MCDISGVIEIFEPISLRKMTDEAFSDTLKKKPVNRKVHPPRAHPNP